MIRSSTFLPFLLLLSGCPDDDVATAGDTDDSGGGTGGVSSTSSPGSTTGESTAATTAEPTTGSDTGLGFDCIDLQKVVDSPVDLEAKCVAHPFELPDNCTTRDPLPTCEEMITLMAGLPACDGIDICDYYKCADALAEAPCGTGARLPECEEIMDCINEPAPPSNACCDEHGVGIQPGLCGVSSENFCVDCDWTPVLCMTHGCGTPGEEDCCLSAQGETVLCAPLVAAHEPVILGCNIPGNMCAELELDCIAAGIETGRCVEIAEAVCPDNKCLACDRAILDCEASGGDCKELESHCDAALRGCGCEFDGCRDVTELELTELFSMCFAWPLSLGHCDDPSAGQCMTTLPWMGCAGLTTCEYTRCMEKVALFGTCDENIPAECAEVEACIASEAKGG